MTEKKRRKLVSLSVFTVLILFAILLFWKINGFAADSSMILKRNTEQNLNGAFSSYNRNGAVSYTHLIIFFIPGHSCEYDQ